MSNADKAHDMDPDGRWLTFDELAEIRSIDKASAVRLVRRHKWRRQADNKRIVRALVPLDWLGKTDEAPDMSADRTGDISRISNAFEIAVTALRERAEAAERLRDAEGEARQRAEAAAKAAEAAATAAQADADQARAAAQEATQAAEAWAAADAARRGRPLLARLRAALRGE